jgi:peroxin-19
MDEKVDENLDALLDEVLNDFSSVNKNNVVEKKKEEEKNSDSIHASFAAELEKMFGEQVPNTSSFQETIDATLGRIKTSLDTSVQEDGDFESLMKEFEQNMHGLGLGEDGISGFESLVDSMMGQLLSKDILYQPLTDLAMKYPEWLKRNKSSLSDNEYQNYKTQYECCKEIIQIYDGPDEDKVRITEIMQKMQDCGQPPTEILQQLAPDMEFGSDGLPVSSNNGMKDCLMQ